MPAFQIARSIEINASAETIFDTVSDFSTWTTWSPWLGIDPAATVSVSDDPRSVGSTYKWTGDIVGQGQMRHQRLDRPHQMECDLQFLKPFRSQSTVRFEIEPAGDRNKLTWHMLGSLPWFLFWMKPMMETYVGMDYQRGLKMLCELIETGTVLSRTEVVGIETCDATQIVGVHSVCPMDEIGPTMQRSLATVCEKLHEVGVSPGSEVISIYHPSDLKTGKFDFTSGVVADDADQLPAPLLRHSIPSRRVLHLRHTGRYANLGNVWSGAYQYARYKKIKIAKADAFEIYRNDPQTTPEADLITDIYLPLK